MPVGSPGKGSRLAGKRTGDDTGHLVLTIEKLAGDFADLVLAFDRIEVFVGRDLKDTVRGRVHDQMTGGKMLRSELVRMVVPDDVLFPRTLVPTASSKASMTSGGNPLG